MRTRNLLPAVTLLFAVASVNAIKLGPSGWTNGKEEPSGITASLGGVTVSDYDIVIVAICGNSALAPISSITVNLTEPGNPELVVAEAIELSKIDSSGGLNQTPPFEMVGLYQLENIMPGTYDLQCELAGLSTETFVFGYQVLKSQYGEYIVNGYPSPSKVSGDSVESLNLSYQVMDTGGYALEALSSNYVWTTHTEGGQEIFSTDGSREFHAYKVNESGFVMHSHGVDFGGTTDTAVGIGMYFVGFGGSTPQWKGYEIVQDVWVDTLGWMGWLQVDADPYIYSLSLSGWMYIPESQTGTGGAWVYIYR